MGVTTPLQSLVRRLLKAWRVYIDVSFPLPTAP